MLLYLKDNILIWEISPGLLTYNNEPIISEPEKNLYERHHITSSYLLPPERMTVFPLLPETCPSLFSLLESPDMFSLNHRRSSMSRIKTSSKRKRNVKLKKKKKNCLKRWRYLDISDMILQGISAGITDLK